MAKRFEVSDNDKNHIRKLYLLESDGQIEKDDRKFCHGGNTKTLSDIIGDDEYEDYVDGVRIRSKGLNSLLDKIELLKTLRMHSKINDGGVHLSSSIYNDLNQFKPYNYFDETKKQCGRVMDKIIELYKENEYGDELVRDIERVYNMSTLEPRAKEYLKHGLEILRGK